MARLRHEFTLTAIPRAWFEEVLATCHERAEPMIAGWLSAEPALRIVRGTGPAAGARYVWAPPGGERSAVIDLLSWDRSSETDVRVTADTARRSSTWEFRVRSASAPRALGVRGSYRGSGFAAAYRRMSWSSEVDLRRWWRCADEPHGNDRLGARTAPPPARAIVRHRLFSADIALTPHRADTDGRWFVTAATTVRGRWWAWPLVTLALLIWRRQAEAEYRQYIDDIVESLDTDISAWVSQDAAEWAEELARSVGSDLREAARPAPEPAAARTRRGKGRFLAIGLMLLGCAWFFAGWGVQDESAAQRAAHGGGRPGMLTDLEKTCDRYGCHWSGTFTSLDGTFVRWDATYSGTPAAHPGGSVPAVDYGDFNRVFAPGAVPPRSNWAGPLAIGSIVLLVAVGCCAVSYVRRAGQRWIVRGGRSEAPPPGAVVVPLHRGKARPLAACAGLLAASTGLLAAVAAAIAAGREESAAYFGWAFTAAVAMVVAGGGAAQNLRALRRRTFLWLGSDELIVRDRALFAADVRIPRSAVRAAVPHGVPRDHLPDVGGGGSLQGRLDAWLSERVGLELDLFGEYQNLLVVLRDQVEAPPAQTGWNGSWSWSGLGRNSQMRDYLIWTGHRFNFLRIAAQHPENAADLVNAWAGSGDPSAITEPGNAPAQEPVQRRSRSS